MYDKKKQYWIVIAETYSVIQDSKLWLRLTLFNCEFSLELQGGSGVLLILLKQVVFFNIPVTRKVMTNWNSVDLICG